MTTNRQGQADEPALEAEPELVALEVRSIPIVSREPIHEQILPHMRRDIINHRWKPGTRLPEPLICREFGISRTPLRQALKSLEMEGLVRLVPNVGAIVTEVDQVQVREHMETLTALEAWAAHRLASGDRPEAVQRVEDLFEKMRRAGSEHDVRRYYELNDQFHRAIVVGTGNQVLADMHENVMLHVQRERLRTNAREPLHGDSVNSHTDILDAIRSGDGEAASRAMRDHLERITRMMLSLW